eukprot:10673884-Alexandrium_andersonii.AAC.1
MWLNVLTSSVGAVSALAVMGGAEDDNRAMGIRRAPISTQICAKLDGASLRRRTDADARKKKRRRRPNISR